MRKSVLGELMIRSAVKSARCSIKAALAQKKRTTRTSVLPHIFFSPDDMLRALVTSAAPYAARCNLRPVLKKNGSPALPAKR